MPLPKIPSFLLQMVSGHTTCQHGKSTSTIDRSPQRPNSEKAIPRLKPPQTPKIHVEWKQAFLYWCLQIWAFPTLPLMCYQVEWKPIESQLPYKWPEANFQANPTSNASIAPPFTQNYFSNPTPTKGVIGKNTRKWKLRSHIGHHLMFLAHLRSKWRA